MELAAAAGGFPLTGALLLGVLRRRARWAPELNVALEPGTFARRRAR